MDWILYNWKPLFEIFLLTIGFCFMLRFMKGTRGEGILKGLGILVALFIGLAFFSQIDYFDFHVIRHMIKGFFTVLMFGLVVIFQPELRRFLIRLGEKPLLGIGGRTRKESIHHIVNACQTLSSAKIGALIAIERSLGLGTYVEGGVRLDARLSAKLLSTIFKPGTPLHDGAVIINGNLIVAAGCLFPLTENPEIDNLMFGTRHRAGIGISEESDAFVIVISEETSDISICFQGQIERGIGFEHLKQEIETHCFLEPNVHVETELDGKGQA